MMEEMGARYEKEWSEKCTHLICNSTATPKFKQAKNISKIVKSDWTKDCHKDKVKHPESKYLTDAPAATKRKIDETSSSKQSKKSKSGEESGSDTDPMNEDELKKIAKPVSSPAKKKAEGSGSGKPLM